MRARYLSLLLPFLTGLSLFADVICVTNGGFETGLVSGNPPQVPAGGRYAVDFDPFWNVATGALLTGTVTGTLPLDQPDAFASRRQLRAEFRRSGGAERRHGIPPADCHAERRRQSQPDRDHQSDR